VSWFTVGSSSTSCSQINCFNENIQAGLTITITVKKMAIDGHLTRFLDGSSDAGVLVLVAVEILRNLQSRQEGGV
jgi:hypothetical protein